MSQNGYQIVLLAGTTDASGDATVDSEKPVTGELLFVEVEGAALTDSANLTLSPLLNEVAGTEEVGPSYINHADIGNAAIDHLYPRTFAQDNAGVDLVIATGHKAAVPYFVPGARLRAVVAAGGNTKAFRIRAFVR